MKLHFFSNNVLDKKFESIDGKIPVGLEDYIKGLSKETKVISLDIKFKNEVKFDDVDDWQNMTDKFIEEAIYTLQSNT